MHRARFLLLSLVTVMSVSAILASSASAAISFEWNVNGAKLEAGQSKEFTTSADGKLTLELPVSGGAPIQLLSSELSILKGAKIIGGVPGTSASTAVFKGVTVDKPANCGVLQTATTPGTIQTTLLKTEIVEGAPGGVGNGQVEMLFTPKTTGTELWTTFEFTGVSCVAKGGVVPIVGLLLAEALPQKAEALTGALDFEASASKEYKTHTGTTGKALLVFAGNDASLRGLILVALVSDEKFGAF